MPKPQSPDIRRSERGAIDDSSVKEKLTAQRVPSETEGSGSVPDQNLPGHHPEVEQDKPVARFRQRARRVAAEAHERQAEPQEHELQVGDLHFRGLLAGREAGELVVLLHGFPQNRTTWLPQVHALAEEAFRVWAPDQRGYSPGARPAGRGQYAIDLLVRDVLGMAEKLGHHSFHLVGHDWGGAVAWAAAALHPDRVKSLTVVSTPHPRAMVTSLVRSDQILRSSYMGLLAAPVVPELLLGANGGRALKLVLTRSGLPEEQAAEYVRDLLAGGGLSAALNWYRALRPAGTRLGPVEVPTLYVWSDRDTALGPVAASATARYVRAPYRFEKLNGVSHWVPETRPEQLTELIFDHLASVGAGQKAS
jgi:pimeloyl-ACP methyl ester carboxylesterase